MANQLDHARSRTQIPKRFEQCEFASFDTDIWTEAYHGPDATAYNQSLVRAKVIVEGFAKEYPARDHRGILLMGNSGTGKTHLAVSALRVLMERGHQVLFYDYSDLLKALQSSYSNSSVSESSILETVIGVEILLIDDLGASKPSEWTREIVGHVLNKRYSDNRTTLLTTNYSDEQAPVELIKLPNGRMAEAPREESLPERVGQRVYSRIVEMCRVVKVSALDFRKYIKAL